MKSSSVSTPSAGWTIKTSGTRTASVSSARSLRQSNGILLTMNGMADNAAAPARQMVWPSGALFASASTPVSPPAPARTSTTTCCPSSALSALAKARPNKSAAPPAANGTISRIGRFGKACARAVVGHSAATARAQMSARREVPMARAISRIAILTQLTTKTNSILPILETQRRTDYDHPCVRPQASIAIENAGARTDDVLHLRLQRPPRRHLRLVHHLDHGFPAAHREEEVSEESGVGIEPARIVADAGVGGGNADLVVRAQGYEAFVNEAAVGIEIDEIAVLRNAAGAHESRQALVVAAGDAVEHLVDDAVDAGIAGVIERNAGRLRVREREAVIVETLVAEARAGVVPGSDPVRAGKASGVLALVGQIARLCDEEGAAAKARNGAGRKRRRLIGAVSSAGIAAEHGRLKGPLLGGLDAHANAGGGQRIVRS